MLCIGIEYAENPYKIKNSDGSIQKEGISYKYTFFMQLPELSSPTLERRGICVAIPATRGSRSPKSYSVRKSDLFASLNEVGYPDLDPFDLIGANFDFYLNEYGQFAGIRNLSWENR